MKAIMISIKPKWCAKIMNGEKTIEVRKNKALANAIQKLIDENGYADIYVYCSKDDDLGCIKKISKNKYVCGKDFDIKDFNYLASGYNGKGKVVFKFRCYNATEYVNGLNWEYVQHDAASYDDYETILEPSCLTDDELCNYVDDLSFCAIHISDLEIFDKPKELSEFHGKGYEKRLKRELEYSGDIAGIVSDTVSYWYRIKKAPQNYCYVEIGK